MKEQLKGAAKTIAVFFLLLLCLWGYIGTRIGVWNPVAYVDYIICIIGTMPLGFELWHGKIKPGDSVSKLLEKVNPYDVIQYGKWTEVRVTPGCWKKQERQILLGEHIWIVAEDDRMVMAGFGGCTFRREFFNTLSPEERAENARDFREHASKKVKQKKDETQQSPPN